MIYPNYCINAFEYEPVKPVYEVNFGVYSQQSAKTTGVKYNFYLTYDIISKEDCAVIEAFLIENRGKEFTFNNPLNSTNYNVRLKGELPKFSFVDFNNRSIATFTLEEV